MLKVDPPVTPAIVLGYDDSARLESNFMQNFIFIRI